VKFSRFKVFHSHRSAKIKILAHDTDNESAISHLSIDIQHRSQSSRTEISRIHLHSYEINLRFNFNSYQDQRWRSRTQLFVNRSNTMTHQKNAKKLSDLSLAGEEIENFKFGLSERHYDSTKAKTYSLLTISLLAAIIILFYIVGAILESSQHVGIPASHRWYHRDNVSCSPQRNSSGCWVFPPTGQQVVLAVYFSYHVLYEY